MADKRYNSMIGATAGCTLRLTEETIAEDYENERHVVHGDAWFGSIKTASELAIQGFECMLQVKQYHALYPKDFIEEALRDAAGGVAIYLEGMAPNKVPLIVIGYRYS